MSTLRHPNIVQFLGVTFFPGSRLPALVMERLLTSLHELVDTPSPRDAVPLAFFLHGSQVLRTAGRGSRTGLPARAIAAHHPPRLVGQKHSPELRDGGQDSRPGRSSYRARCSHHDKGSWGLCVHASRGHCTYFP